MDYTKLTLHNCQNLAIKNFGFESTHTIAIAQLVDLVTDGYLDKDHATQMAQIIYDHGANELCYDYDMDYESDVDEEGFDPYMGCYTGDC